VPERRAGAWVVRGKQQRKHIKQAEGACKANADSQRQGDSDGEFSVGGKESDRASVGKYEISQNRGHERVGAVLEEAVDPSFESAMQGELRAEDFVLGENQKQDSDADAQKGEGTSIGVLWVRVSWHRCLRRRQAYHHQAKNARV